MSTGRMDSVIRHLHQAVIRDDEPNRTDGELLASFIDRHDSAAFAALVRRHGPMVFGVCRRIVHSHHDAEDAFQATFLVLARKASSVRPRERLANWLHGVALRTAMKARAMSSKRLKRETPTPALPEPETAPHDPWLDLQPLLDQELNGLPEYYRLPILLCDLEGHSIKEATRRLGWPQGTLAGRLVRGRKLLARRLASRGVTLSAGALAALVSQQSSRADVPAALMSSTVNAAASAGAVPVQVAILTEGVLKAMLLNKLKLVATGALVLVVLIGSAGAIYRTQAAEPPRPIQEPNPAAARVVPPRAADARYYVITTKMLEAAAGEPNVVTAPRVMVEDGQPCHVGLDNAPRNLLAKVIDDEKMKVGTHFDVRITRLGGAKVRLFLSLQTNAIETSDVNEIRVVGNNVQVLQVVELRKNVTVVLEKNAEGKPRRWVDLTVDEVNTAAPALPPPARSNPVQDRTKNTGQ